MFPDTPPYAGFRDLVFPAKLTAATLVGGVYHYTWTEQSYDSAGAFTDPIQPRTGNDTFSPALELNNQSVGVPTYVWLRLRTSLGGNLYYEFAAGSGTSELFPVRITRREWVTATAVVFDAGTNYAVNDTVTLAADRVNLIVKVLTVDGTGGILTSEIVQIGVYNVGDNPSNPQTPSATSGIGTGATFTVNLVAVTGSDPTTFYSWVEQTESADGVLTDLGGGRTGTVPTNAAIQINKLFVAVGAYAWLRFSPPGVSVTYDGGPVLGPFYEFEAWLLRTSAETGGSDTATTDFSIVGDGANITTEYMPGGFRGEDSVMVKGSASPSFTNVNISDSVFLGGSATFNFNNVTILNFPGSSSIAFHGARFPSATSTIIGTGSHKDCTFSVSGGTNFGAAGYDVDGTLINGGKAARIAVSGYYHFTSASLWFASSYLNARIFINTSANGSDIITKGLVRTSAGGTIDEDGIYILECSGDYSCAAGDTITVAVWNMDTLLSATMDDAMLHFHRIPTS